MSALNIKCNENIFNNNIFHILIQSINLKIINFRPVIKKCYKKMIVMNKREQIEIDGN